MLWNRLHFGGQRKVRIWTTTVPLSCTSCVNAWVPHYHQIKERRTNCLRDIRKHAFTNWVIVFLRANLRINEDEHRTLVREPSGAYARTCVERPRWSAEEDHELPSAPIPPVPLLVYSMPGIGVGGGDPARPHRSSRSSECPHVRPAPAAVAADVRTSQSRAEAGGGRR